MSENASGLLAPLVHAALTFTIPAALLLAGERFTPPEGLLAAIVPQIRQEQARLLFAADDPRGKALWPIGETAKAETPPAVAPTKATDDAAAIAVSKIAAKPADPSEISKPAATTAGRDQNAAQPLGCRNAKNSGRSSGSIRHAVAGYWAAVGGSRAAHPQRRRRA